ncbi:MAG: cadherin domain-containing protein, partial [Planctomycetota bacterium]
SGNNTYDGITTIAAGAIEAASDNALGASSAGTVINSGYSLALLGNITMSEPITISGAGFGGLGAIFNGNGNNTISGAITLGASSTIGSLSGNLTFSGAISDGASSFDLTKVRPGTVILSGVNTYDGTTTVNGGVLQVDGSIAGSVTLTSGTLTGSGTVNGSGIIASGTATVDPGTVGGTGILTYANATGLTLPSSSTFHIDINGPTAGTGYDQLKLTNGSALFNPNGATLEIQLGYIPTINTSFQIVSQAYGSPITGRFNSISQFGSVTSGYVTFSVGYFNSGIILTVTAVNIPTLTWTGLGGNNNWSTAANWSTNVAPVGGENLVFPTGATRLSNVNDLSNKSFNTIQIGGSGYNISGNALTVAGGLSSTYGSGTSTFGLNTTLTGTETFDIASGGTLDMSGKITGSGFGVTKTGAGTLKYSGSTANDYSGTTTINGGTLLLAKSDDVIAVNGAVIVGDNAVGATLTVAGNNQFWVGADVTVNQGSTFNVGTYVEKISNLNLQGSTVQIDAGGVLETFAGINSYITTNNVTSVIQGLGALQIDNTTNSFTIANDLDIPVELRISVVVQGNLPTSGFIKNGAGTLALAGANTFGGDVFLNAGTITVESDAALGTSVGATVVSSGASLYFDGASLVSTENFTISGAGVASSGVLYVISGSTTLSGSVVMVTNSQVGGYDDTTLRIDGIVSGPHSLTKIGAGTLALSGSNTYSGNTTALDGFLLATGSNAFGLPAVASSISVETGATLELSGGITIPATKTISISGVPVTDSSKIMSLSGDNTIQGDIGITGGNNVAFDVASGTNLTVSGVISGALDFDKNGSGTLILSGTNTHTGNVNVGNGTLLVNGSLATSNSVFVDGIVGGTGTLPAVTLSSIGTLSPGNSPGIVDSGNLTFQDSGSTYFVQLNGTTAGTGYDQTNVTGTVTLAGATLSISLGYVPAGGDSFVIINNDGTDAVNGTFNGLPEGASLTVGGQQFTISYLGGSLNNDVVLYANNAPTAIQLGSATVTENAPIGTVVSGFTTTDADFGDTFTYTLVNGVGDDDNDAFGIDGSGNLVTAANIDYETQTSYSVLIRSTDASGLYTEQFFIITVLAVNDNAPIFSSSATFNVAENTTAVGTVIATDADLPSQTVTYSITGGADSTLFSIDSATGILTFNVAPNYEAPTDAGANNVYNVDVTANDNSGLTTVQSIAVTVTPVNDNAPIFSSSATFNVAENTTAVGTVIATDADLPGQTVTYSITGGADSTLFSIDSATGILTFNVAPNYESPTDAGANNVYNVEVTANDNSGSTTVQSIAVTVTPVNDNAPIFSSSATFNVAENTTGVGTVIATDADLPGQTVTYSITGGADSTLFSIDSATGILTFNVAPNYESPTDAGANNVYNVDV